MALRACWCTRLVRLPMSPGDIDPPSTMNPARVQTNSCRRRVSLFRPQRTAGWQNALVNRRRPLIDFPALLLLVDAMPYFLCSGMYRWCKMFLEANSERRTIPRLFWANIRSRQLRERYLQNPQRHAPSSSGKIEDQCVAECVLQTKGRAGTLGNCLKPKTHELCSLKK